MTTCEDRDQPMTVDRTTGDPTCLQCVRAAARHRLWRDGIEQARRALAEASR